MPMIKYELVDNWREIMDHNLEQYGYMTCAHPFSLEIGSIVPDFFQTGIPMRVIAEATYQECVDQTPAGCAPPPAEYYYYKIVVAD
jgi:hypothetical protein